MKLGQTRWLLFAQQTSSVPTPLVAMLVFWLTVIFMSFGLFVRPNLTVVSSLLISALAVCGAIFLILEMYQPYTGLIRVSTAPLQSALAQLGK
jgi:nitric oxide reductase large subunit